MGKLHTKNEGSKSRHFKVMILGIFKEIMTDRRDGPTDRVTHREVAHPINHVMHDVFNWPR